MKTLQVTWFDSFPPCSASSALESNLYKEKRFRDCTFEYMIHCSGQSKYSSALMRCRPSVQCPMPSVHCIVPHGRCTQCAVKVARDQPTAQCRKQQRVKSSLGSECAAVEGVQCVMRGDDPAKIGRRSEGLCQPSLGQAEGKGVEL